MRIDLHCHTDCSDGNVTIEERIAMIKACHYDAATITDHDFISTEQVQRAQEACDNMPFVPGIELSLRHEGKVVHLLAYFIDPESQKLQNHLRLVQEIDRDHTRQLLTYYQQQGIRLTMDDLIADSLHTFYSICLVKAVAKACGYNSKRGLQNFNEVLQALHLTYSDFAPWEVKNAIDLVHQAGGIAVLAHPGGQDDFTMNALGFLLHNTEHLKRYTDWGLDGLEVANPVHSLPEIQKYTDMARDLGLFVTAGSDCHGDDPFVGPALMGRSVAISENSYENLLVRLDSKPSMRT